MSKWKPIETAPKDGTAVLLCQATDAAGKAIDWRADRGHGLFCQVAVWWGHEFYGSWVVYCSMVKDPELFFKPTHWRKLPKPPVISQEVKP